MERLLLRLVGMPTAPRDPAGFQAGLRLHVQHTDLVSIVVQIGAQQQAYLSLLGCAGCRCGRCTPGCSRALFCRLWEATRGSGQLTPVPQGLAARPYTRVALAWPSRQSRPFDLAQLAPWPEARLVVQWKGGAGDQVTAGAMLAVGAAPHPATFFRVHGWTTCPLPRNIRPGAATSATPVGVWRRRPWPGAPFLLMPHARHLPGAGPAGELAGADGQP